MATRHIPVFDYLIVAFVELKASTPMSLTEALRISVDAETRCLHALIMGMVKFIQRTVTSMDKRQIVI